MLSCDIILLLIQQQTNKDLAYVHCIFALFSKSLAESCIITVQVHQTSYS